jgi:hypothetical protein
VSELSSGVSGGVRELSGNSFKISYLGLQLLLKENVGDQHGWEIKG